MSSTSHSFADIQGKQRRKKRRSSSRSSETRVYNLRSTTRRKGAVTKESHHKQHDVASYSKLDRQSNEIRVLILQPGVETDAIQGTLETHQLDKCPEFEALSYAWGNPERTDEIFLDGSRVMVTHSLSVALRHIRLAESCRTLWIDAICINQIDTNERNHQVFMMNRVYSSAKLVLAWLGEARGSSDIAMEKLTDLGKGQELTSTEESSLRDLIRVSLLDRDWWSRLWIVQEVVLAKSHPIIICGSCSLPWDIFMDGCFKANCKLVSPGVPEDKAAHRMLWFQLTEMRHAYLSSTKLLKSADPSIDPIFAMLRTKDFNATDPRDKIYGCLGLLKREEREAMRPEYQKPVEVVYFETTKYFLENIPGEFYGIFSVHRMADNIFPSWVPDFSAQKSISPQNPRGRTCDPTDLPRGQRCVSFRDHNKTLSIRGVFFDSIREFYHFKDNEGSLLDQMAGLEKLVQEGIDQRIPSKHPYHSFQEFKERVNIWEVLVGGPRDFVSGLGNEYRSSIQGEISTPLSQERASKLWANIHFVLRNMLLGRYLFVTHMGFSGVSVANIRENDCVTFLFGEIFPTVLRCYDSTYIMLGAAYLPRAIVRELFDMYEKGLVKEETFLIR